MLKCLLIKYVKMTEYPAFCLPDNSLYAFLSEKIEPQDKEEWKGKLHLCCNNN